MNIILIKLFATALTLSQVTTRPDAVKTQFDPVTDKAQVVQIPARRLRHMRKAFDIEDINLDELISTAMEDPSAVAGASAPKILHGLDIGELNISYRQFCKGENPKDFALRRRRGHRLLQQGARRPALGGGPEGAQAPGCQPHPRWRGQALRGSLRGQRRRLSVPIAEVPAMVQKAFVAAEDKRFETHKGIDERGVIRAFIG